MTDLPEFNNFIAGIKPLINSADLLVKSSANMNKKNWGWGDLFVFGLTFLNFSCRAVKTADDFNHLIEAVKNPKPLPTPIDARFLLQLQNPALALLNNQQLNFSTR
ncbi:hypothetical protein H6S82_01450 [Planktothrix sp. FACHB-1355]|uniref:hypothetical protein n=1 Tax=Planktothrix sp. FACHB-1355 TaxID=2692854 RepID=UPI00168BE555|nr:hypothetical protein [Planktothrix sp. FACHB-1355]MBD3557533.1 hypothetical protein [Planktothrix sp. FACHB-1355]MBD3885891.1 hypothetical protein [Phormidium tenue FACHB-886]